MFLPLTYGIVKAARLRFEDLTDEEKMYTMAQLWYDAPSKNMGTARAESLTEIPEEVREKTLAKIVQGMAKQHRQLESGRRVTTQNMALPALTMGFTAPAGGALGAALGSKTRMGGTAGAIAGGLAGLAAPLIYAYAKKRPPQEERIARAAEGLQRSKDIAALLRNPKNLRALDEWSKMDQPYDPQGEGYSDI